MKAEKLYQYLMNLAPPWHVKAVVVEDDAPEVMVFLEHKKSAGPACPLCGCSCSFCGRTEEKSWRHLDTCQKQTIVIAELPAVNCPEHGRQLLVPPCGDADSPVTFAYASMLKRVARDSGSLKRAAVITRLAEDTLRDILRQVSGLPSIRKDPTASAPVDTPAAPAPDQTRQLSLFSQDDMVLVNQGIQALKSLQLEQAVALFRKHQKVFPKAHDVNSKIALAEYLLHGMEEAPSELDERIPLLCHLWNRFEDHVESLEMRPRDRLVSELRRSYFERLLGEIEQKGTADALLISGGIPLGYVFLQVGRYQEAIMHLQAAIPRAPGNAAIYGYLGDAYWLRGDVKTARQCYREGCLIDPAALDWQHLKDGEIKELRHDLQLLFGFDLELATAWLPSHARLNGLFERKSIRLHEGLKELVDEYLSLRKSLAKRPDPLKSARLFFRGIILCENEESLKLVKKIDPIEVRRLMKQANPELFNEFLASVSAKPLKHRKP
jgi:tetratricopeptide (TPR) repeat protein